MSMDDGKEDGTFEVVHRGAHTRVCFEPETGKLRYDLFESENLWARCVPKMVPDRTFINIFAYDACLTLASDAMKAGKPHLMAPAGEMYAALTEA